jgi:hypothetical protein
MDTNPESGKGFTGQGKLDFTEPLLIRVHSCSFVFIRVHSWSPFLWWERGAGVGRCAPYFPAHS